MASHPAAEISAGPQGILLLPGTSQLWTLWQFDIKVFIEKSNIWVTKTFLKVLVTPNIYFISTKWQTYWSFLWICNKVSQTLLIWWTASPQTRLVILTLLWAMLQFLIQRTLNPVQDKHMLQRLQSQNTCASLGWSFNLNMTIQYYIVL